MSQSLFSFLEILIKDKRWWALRQNTQRMPLAIYSLVLLLKVGAFFLMQHFPALPNKSEDTIVNAWQWAQYNSEECEQWPLGKLYSDFTFDLFSQEQYLYNKVTPSLLAPCPHVTDVLMCWLLRPFFKSSWLQSRKNNRKLDIWAPPLARWVFHQAELFPYFGC